MNFCQADTATECYNLIDSNYGDAVSPEILAGLVFEPKIAYSTYSAGNLVMMSVSFRPSNPFPADGIIEVHLAPQYVLQAGLSFCSVVLENGVCPMNVTCMRDPRYCTFPLNQSALQLAPAQSEVFGQPSDMVNLSHGGEDEIAAVTSSTLFPPADKLGQAPFINKLYTPGYIGVPLSFNVSAVRTRPNSGAGDVFRIVVRDGNGRVVDDSDNFVTPFLVPNRLVVASVNPISFVPATVTGYTAQFKTFNPIPADGRIRVTFPAGYDIISAALSWATDQAGLQMYMDGGATVQVDTAQNVVSVLRDGSGTPVGTGMFVQIALYGVKNRMAGGDTGSFGIATATATDSTIDEVNDALPHQLVPGILSDPSVDPAIKVAGQNGSVQVDFDFSVDVLADDTSVE
eukprot:2352074-Rhodomonas_salina.1